MIRKTWLAAALLVAAAAHAQTAPQASANGSQAKKELISRILAVQQPGIEGTARRLIEQPAAEIMGAAANALPQRIAADRQEAVAKDIQGEVQKFVDDTAPQVQKRAVALAPSSIGPLLEERFSEEELRQILSIMESPVYGKFQKMGDELQRALVEKLVADTRPMVEPKVRALEQSVANKLGVSATQQGAAPAPTPKGKAPAKKQP